MGTLRYAMLGLIQRAPATGYDISKAFSGRLGSIWGARHSQIYPELKKLTEEGLVNCTVISELQEKSSIPSRRRGRKPSVHGCFRMRTNTARPRIRCG